MACLFPFECTAKAGKDMVAISTKGAMGDIGCTKLARTPRVLLLYNVQPSWQ